ncbi:hypothetical protein BV22DRAFT_1040306 [Leucogyrophana mollusca]|uniref:Uncharacterized protein n=1 Tax=Leucogyrophana mollusca TaxID=85980 RepID=A0ACB8B2U4_9AGAM|nr:hypothetical protein BV22DRAFT_1040306 [Leucogyrophana mollusca]
MRPPNYRPSHRVRYHPYPRYAFSQRERLMQTIDEQNDADQGKTVHASGAAEGLLPVIQELDEETANLEQALPPVESTEGERIPTRHRSISTVIVDLALSFMRRLLPKHP